MDSILNVSRPTLCRVRNLMACYVTLLFLAITGLAQTTDPKKEFTGVFKFKNDGLSQRLLEAKTKEELQKLLDTESRNLSVQLRRSLVAQGNTPLAEGNYARAFDVYTIAQRVAEIINDREGIAATSLNIGTVYFLQGDYDNALNNYQKAYPIFERLGDQAEAARALVGIGSTLKEQGKGNAAVAPLQQAFTKFSSLKVPGSQEESSNILNLLGSIYYEEGKYELAKTTFAQSLLLVGSPSNILDVGNAYYSAGAYSQALELFLKALAQFESQRNTASISSALGSLANTYFALGDTEKALTYYQQNLRIIESLGDKNGAVSILQNMGDVYRLSGDFANALFSYTQSIKYADELAVGSASVSGSKLNTAVAAGGIGLVRAGQGDTVQALNYFHQSLSQFEKMGDKIGISRMLVNIGNSFGVQENYTEALDSYRKALALREEMGDTVNVAKILQNIGSVQISQDRLLEALESYQKSLALIKGVGNRMGEADVLVNIARTYRLIGQYSQAIDSAKSASTLVEGKDLSDTLWRAYLESGKSHLALKQIPEARVDLDRAVKTIESIRTAPFSIERERSSARSAVTPYYTMMEMLIGENKVDEAFEFAERGKTELLWSILQSGGTASSKSLSPQERQQESKMLDEIASLATQVKRAEARGRQEIVELQKRLRAARERFVVFRRTTATSHPFLKTEHGELRPLEVNQIKALINDTKTAFVEYIVSEEKLYLFVVTSKLTGKPERTLTTKLYDLGIGYKELVGRVLRFRQQIEQLDSATAQTSVELYDLLLKPAAEQLLNKSRLIIAPDSVLWGLSFQALMPAPERFLIEDVELFYVPSLTAYREIKNDTRPRVRAANTKQLVVFNHPTYSNQSTEFMQLMSGNNKLAQSLPDNESQPLSEVFGLRQSTLFSDTEASETRARSLGSAYRIIQFNAIARLEDASPMYSYVALSPDKNGGNDGFLLTREIMQLDERANLIIYSAASPVRDQIQNGDSLIGLSWAWFVAGSPALMTSQWITSPDCTTELMANFYAKIKAGGKEVDSSNYKSGAFRQAVLQQIQRSGCKEPYAWANLMSIGKW